MHYLSHKSILKKYCIQYEHKNILKKKIDLYAHIFLRYIKSFKSSKILNIFEIQKIDFCLN